MTTTHELHEMLYFQKAATDALQTMTSVLKNTSSAGESYEVLFDGARSLVTGLGNMLRLSSYEAREYDITLNDDSADSAALNRRRRSDKEWVVSFANILGRRWKRGTTYQQLQSRKEVRRVLPVLLIAIKIYFQ